MVSGFVQMKNYNGRRKFVQTFFLAPQEKGYFVLNDILHFLDEEPSSEPSSTDPAYSNYDNSLNVSSHMPEPVSRSFAEPNSAQMGSGYMLGEETQAGEYLTPGHVLAEEIQTSSYAAPVHAEESDAIDDYSVPEPQEAVSEHDDRTDEIPAEEPVASLPNSTSMVRDLPPAPSEEHVGERPKLTMLPFYDLRKDNLRCPCLMQLLCARPLQ
ncbi:putative G3BP-like protein [Iris pallida]|uniref:G3BP-like protein n=1 Tax=Iris pallida TaxID=29817 RepID=A0AAX6IIZ7_IRIPA|nr:putative G3BP-like protein [Iris pallida]